MTSLESTGVEAGVAQNQCQHFLRSKGRLCRYQAKAGHQFCGNHLPAAAGVERVPCPCDPRHTIWKHELETHVKRCTAAKQRAASEAQPYFRQDCNAGSDEEADAPVEGTLPPPKRGGEADDPQGAAASFVSSTAPAPEGVRRELVWRRGPEWFAQVVQKVEAAHAALLQQHPLQLCASHTPAADVDALRREAREASPLLRFTPKHAVQNAAIVAAMARNGLLAPLSRGGVCVELGAGKGWLGEAATRAAGGTGLVLVDRQGSFKGKADTRLRHLPVLRRLTVDLKDLDLSGVQELQSAGISDQQPVAAAAAPPPTPLDAAAAGPAAAGRLPAGAGTGCAWVVTGKHLCGAATDFSLRACVQALQQGVGRQPSASPPRPAGAAAAPAAVGSRASPAADKAQPAGGAAAGVQAVAAAAESVVPGLRGGLAGLAIATCCHHRCGWRAYVGKRALRAQGVTRADFEAICWMSGWGTGGHRAPPAESDAAVAGGDDGAAAEPAGIAAAVAVEADGARAGGPAWNPAHSVQSPERLALGVKCKQLLDAGRCAWLASVVEKGRVQYAEYVPPGETTGENRLICWAVV